MQWKKPQRASEVSPCPPQSRVWGLSRHGVALVGASQRVVEHAVEAAGGPAFYRRTGLERLLRDVRAGHFHPLPAKQQLRFTGRRLLGLTPIEAWSAPEAAPVTAEVS